MSSSGERDALPSGIVSGVETETQEASSLGSRSLKDVFQVFLVALRLGLTSFGGPIAHLGYFREEYVQRRKWLDEESYADVVALSQSLPGPASSKVGIALGTIRAGLPGGVLAWLGFTLPSSLALVAFAYGLSTLGTAAG